LVSCLSWQTEVKKQRRTIGAVVKINLGDGNHSYARILDKASFAIYDFMTKSEKTIDEITAKNILFIVAVYDDVITDGRWEKIGSKPLEEELKILPMKYMQDSINPNNFSLYNPNTGEIIPAKRGDCAGLECAAVWEAEHVEDRIRDHYAGKKNKWLEQLEIR
jgi:hypothetical protein